MTTDDTLPGSDPAADAASQQQPRPRRRTGDQPPADILAGTRFEGWPEVDPQCGEREPFWEVTAETFLESALQQPGNLIVFHRTPTTRLMPSTAPPPAEADRDR